MAECEFLNIDYILAEEEKIVSGTRAAMYNLEGLEYGFITLKAAILQELDQNHQYVANGQRGKAKEGKNQD